MILELPAADLRALARIARLTRINGAMQLASSAILAVAWALAFLKLGTIAVTSVVGVAVYLNQTLLNEHVRYLFVQELYSS